MTHHRHHYHQHHCHHHCHHCYHHHHCHPTAIVVELGQEALGEGPPEVTEPDALGLIVMMTECCNKKKLITSQKSRNRTHSATFDLDVSTDIIIVIVTEIFYTQLVYTKTL